MVKCDNCPCLQLGFAEKEFFIEGTWWYCGVDESDIADGNVFRKDVRVKDCPLKRIELKDGFVYQPEVQDGEM